MSETAWLAFYFRGLDDAHPPARTELIEAPNQDEAAKVARSHMGLCKRVDIASPRWESQQDLVILSRDDEFKTG
jgi:hypothetical protein